MEAEEIAHSELAADPLIDTLRIHQSRDDGVPPVTATTAGQPGHLSDQ
jgi:hypothetical protein